MKQKYKKLAFFILLLSMLTGCMLLSGCTENTENGSQSSYIVDSDELQDTENQVEFVPGSMKGSKQEEMSENEEQGQTEQVVRLLRKKMMRSRQRRQVIWKYIL